MKRALISVFDKTGIVDFAKSLDSMGWEIISTGGTSKALKAEGIKVMDISDLTKRSEEHTSELQSPEAISYRTN